MESNRAANDRMDSKLARLHSIGIPPPASCTANSARSILRQACTTVCPSRIILEAASNPMPCDVPVITTVKAFVVVAVSNITNKI